MKKLEKISKISICYITIVILFVLFILNLFYTANIMNVDEIVNIVKVTAISLVLIIFLVGIYLFVCKKITKIKLEKNYKILISIFLLLYLIVSVLWINIANSEPIDDAKSVHNIAVAIVENNTNVLESNTYLEKCPQQIGMVIIFSIIYKIFNSTDYSIIQYLNVIANILTIIALYRITKMIDKKQRVNNFIYFSLFFSMLPLIFLSTLVYSDYIGLSLIAWAIYLIMKYNESNSNKYLIISALLTCLACILKTNYLIILIAIVIYCIIRIFNNTEKLVRKILLILLYSMIVLAPYLSTKIIVANKFYLNTDASLPTSGYIYMGMSESYRGAGWYGDSILYAWEDAEASRKIYPKLIKDRIKGFINNPIYCMDFYMRKTISGWEDPYFQSIWYSLNTKDSEINWDLISNNIIFKITQHIMKAMLFIIYGFSLLHILFNIKKIDINSILLSLIFIGGFLFHTIWEIKARYVLPYIVILIPLATLGICELLETLKTKKTKNKIYNLLKRI